MRLKLIFSFPLIFIFAVITHPVHASSRGKQQFQLCTSCHGPNAEGRKKLAAPSIAGLPQWYIERQLNNFKSGARGQHPKDVPGMRMAPMARSLRYKGDIAAVAAHVAKLPAKRVQSDFKTGNLENGKSLYNICLACHGANGEGNKMMNGPPLMQLDPWYMRTQINNFKSGLRGANAAKDPVGASMAPMAQTLADDQAIIDVITYIMSLK